MQGLPTRRHLLKGLALAGAVLAPVAPFVPRGARAQALTVGLIAIGPWQDWGWNQSFAAAGAALEAAGVTVVEAGYLPESTDYDSGRDDAETRAYAAALDALVAQGARLVISTSFGHDPFLVAAALRRPQVMFRQASALANDATPANLGSQNALINQGHYVNGVAAGLCTRSNTLGFVAGLPFAPVLLNVNSFLLGARASNPKAVVRVLFTGGWEDEAHDAAATNALVDAGCDVITCHLDAPKVAIETAEARGVKTCGHAFDQNPLAPKGYITGADYHWAGLFAGFAQAVVRGAALPKFTVGGYDTGLVRSSPFGAGATAPAIAAAEGAIAAMTRGAPIFTGPLFDNKGRQVLGAGTRYGPYADELQRTDYLLQGVIGTIP
ncbi:BMP family ABC transporter substrate-binding protein [Ancylobacter vacuolatus]|uniref:Simple sugar transport system substrate-binding protein n=1 Tax=Ancylobacter vacuolatus TaxID=223389 RepID=A0ABU0DDL2_9HYPH|nr:BMP family ABC transporter substrate-binding protein [Ancylobacter vacuolatus]MDQ0346499.1 simple sugar transport system substrate-binding protein [Ancylobacter vacuolatus]